MIPQELEVSREVALIVTTIPKLLFPEPYQITVPRQEVRGFMDYVRLIHVYCHIIIIVILSS
jgi:hypothetical protein